MTRRMTSGANTGEKKFVFGPWDASYADQFGTYGVDPESRAAWAVVNNIGDFAVAPFEPSGSP